MNGVKDLDLYMYAGKWYEIAKLPNPWQGKCFRSTTDYYVDEQPLKKGKIPEIDVVSTCYDIHDNVLQTFKAHGTIPDKKHKGALKTKWESIPEETWMVIYETDYAHYAIEGDKERKFLWILSRTPTMCVNVIEGLILRSVQLGFDVEPLEIVPGSVTPCTYTES